MGSKAQIVPRVKEAGSIVTSVNDFVRWVKTLMNHEDPINERLYQGLVRTRTFRNPDARRLKPFTSPVAYAAGLDVYYYRGYMVVGHDGVISGFGSRFFFLPYFKFGAVIFGNSNRAGSVASTLARELIDEIFGVPEAERSYRNQSKMAHRLAKAGLTVNAQDKSEN